MQGKGWAVVECDEATDTALPQVPRSGHLSRSMSLSTDSGGTYLI